MSWFMKFKRLADTERHYTAAGVVLYFCLPGVFKSNMPLAPAWLFLTCEEKSLWLFSCLIVTQGIVFPITLKDLNLWLLGHVLLLPMFSVLLLFICSLWRQTIVYSAGHMGSQPWQDLSVCRSGICDFLNSFCLMAKKRKENFLKIFLTFMSFFV